MRVKFLGGVCLVAVSLCTSVHASETTTYTYDALGRLRVVTIAGGPNDGVQTSTSFDPAGNRTSYAVSGAGSSVSISDASVTEGGNLVFTVTRSGRATGAATVNFSSANGTATAGSDYNSTSGTLNFAAGETSKTVTVTTIDDTALEGSETLSVTLSSPSSGTDISRGTATGTIQDNDETPPSFAIANASAVTEGGTLVFVVSKSGSVTKSYSVNYATASGTATSGSDFNAQSGTLTFAAGDTTKTISVSTIDDTVVESSETVLVNLSSPSGGATITTSQASGTINDNDVAAPPSLAISDASALEGFNLVFTVTRSGNTGVTTSVNYATAPGTAATNDYTTTSGTLTFAPGETSKTISVYANTDNRVENDEIFYVNLTSPTGGATLSDSQGAGTIFDDGNGGIGGGCPTC